MGNSPSDDRIHVFYFIHDLAPFGAQRVALCAVRHLDAKRFRITVCSFGGEETLAPEFIKAGAEVVFLRSRRFLDLRTWIRLFQLLADVRPRVLVTNLPELSVPARFAALFFDGMAVVHVFQNPISCEPWGWRLLNRWTLGLCGGVVFVSAGIHDEFLGGFPYMDLSAMVIHNAVSLDESAPGAGSLSREEWGFEAGDKVIGCVGRLVGQKGQDILIDAAAGLLKDGASIRLVLVGDGELLSSLQDRAERLGLGERVKFLGRREDVGRILKSFDLYVAPSRWEGLPVALGEAMASGTPCVGTRIAGHADLLSHKTTGFVADPEDPQALADAISWMIGHPEESVKMALAAKELILKDFTPESMATKYEKLFLSLADR